MQDTNFGTTVHKSALIGDNMMQLVLRAVNDVSGPQEVSAP